MNRGLIAGGFVILVFLVLLLFTGCTTQTGNAVYEVETYTIGFIGPLSGAAVSYGIPAQKAVEFAVAEINAEWEKEGKHLNVIYEDGICTGANALIAAKKLIEIDGVKVILGGVCSGETLTIAPYTEDNQVLLFSALSSSPEITNAGDFVFRNYASDASQAVMMIEFIERQGYEKIAILTENTDAAQGLRIHLLDGLPSIGVEIVTDQVVVSTTRDVRTELTKIMSKTPDVTIFIPQTTPMAAIFVKQAAELGLEAQGIGGGILSFSASIKEIGDAMNGYYVAQTSFANENDPKFIELKEATGCDIGLYCATAYDAAHILAELIEVCDEDTVCMRDRLYAMEEWPGLAGPTTFDENGDVGGNWEMALVQDGEKIRVE